MKFNTSIAQMMIFVNEMYKMERVSREVIEQFVLLLSPYAPHISEELWQRLGNNESLAYHKWPEYDEALTKAEQITVAFSVNGKVRSKRSVDADLSEKDLEQLAFDDDSVKKHIFGKDIVKIIVVKNKMVNIVVK